MKLPKTVYAYIISEGGEEWLSAEATADACAEKGVKRLVGVYELKEKLIVSLEVKTELTIEKTK
jgi:hypothetical protein